MSIRDKLAALRHAIASEFSLANPEVAVKEATHDLHDEIASQVEALEARVVELEHTLRALMTPSQPAPPPPPPAGS